MQMDRDLHRRFDPAYEVIGVERGKSPAMSLMQSVSVPRSSSCFAMIDKPVHAVDGADGIADGGFHMFAAGLHFTHGPFDVADIVQRVEDAEDVDAIGGGPFDESLQHIVGIMPIADEVLPAEQHLQFGVGHGGAQRAQPFPGIFFEKAQAGVEGGAAPDFQRPIADGVELLGDGQHVLRPHARGQERLMAVAQGDVGDQDGFSRRRLNGQLRAVQGPIVRVSRPTAGSAGGFFGALCCVTAVWSFSSPCWRPSASDPRTDRVKVLLPVAGRSEPFVGGDGGGKCQHQILRLLEFVVVEQVRMRLQVGGVETSCHESPGPA